MASRTACLGVFLLIFPVFLSAMLPFPSAQPIHYTSSTTIARRSNDLRISTSAGLLALLPGQPVPAQHFLFPSTGNWSDTYYVGAQAPTSICSSACTYMTNTGVQTTIQVVSQQVDGCLSYWIGDDSSANVWGQVGYYICDGSTPVAFYQIWNLNTYSVLVTGTSAITAGYHQFSMYLSSGTTWAYAVDGNVLGTYDMGANISMPAYPVQALSEEGYVSTPWTPAQVTFSTAIQTFNSGVWSPALTSSEYSVGCNSDGSVGGIGSYAPYSCWGAQGNLQNSTIAADSLVVGGSTPLIPSGSPLWNGTTSLSSSNTVSTASTVSSSSSYSSALSTTSSTAVALRLRLLLSLSSSNTTNIASTVSSSSSYSSALSTTSSTAVAPEVPILLRLPLRVRAV